MGGQQRPAGRRYARWLAAATAGLASLVLLGTGLAGTAQAAYPGTDGLIAFVRHGNIYTINPQSPTPAATVTRLTRDGHDSGPRWSPDGQQLAYLDRGNLWIMRANGGHKVRITDQAPGYTDARPSWSPNGRYLAFVRTRRGHGYGYLTRYDTVTHAFNVFSTPYESEAPTRRQVDVTALPDPIAWGWALDSTGGTYGSFILVEGAGSFCAPAKYCLLALGRPHQYMYRNAFPSAEDFTAKPIRLLDPDFFPVHPLFYLNVMTTQDSCPAGHCAPQGLDLTILASPVIPGAYEGVFSPAGDYIAYVRNVRGVPEIYTADDFPGVPVGTGARALTPGTQPDWQPVPSVPVT